MPVRVLVRHCQLCQLCCFQLVGRKAGTCACLRGSLVVCVSGGSYSYFLFSMFCGATGWAVDCLAGLLAWGFAGFGAVPCRSVPCRLRVACVPCRSVPCRASPSFVQCRSVPCRALPSSVPCRSVPIFSVPDLSVPGRPHPVVQVLVLSLVLV